MGLQEILRRGLGSGWAWAGGRAWVRGLCVQAKVSSGVGWGRGVRTALRLCVRVSSPGRQSLRSGRNHTINSSRCGVSLRAHKDCDSVTWPGWPTGSFLPPDTAGWGQQRPFHHLPGGEPQPGPLLKPPRLFSQRLVGPWALPGAFLCHPLSLDSQYAA